MDRRKFNLIIRVIAGAYLIYMATQLPKQGESTGEPTPSWIYIFVVLFIAAGIFFLILALLQVLNDRKAAAAKKAAEEQEKREKMKNGPEFIKAYVNVPDEEPAEDEEADKPEEE